MVENNKRRLLVIENIEIEYHLNAPNLYVILKISSLRYYWSEASNNVKLRNLILYKI